MAEHNELISNADAAFIYSDQTPSGCTLILQQETEMGSQEEEWYVKDVFIYIAR